MSYRTRYMVYIVLIFATVSFVEQSFGQIQNIRPRGVKGSAGFGLAEYKIHSGFENYLMDDGLFTTVQAETPLDALGLHATLMLNFFKTAGRTNYQYSTLSQTYTASDVAFDAQTFQIGLGMKWRPLEAVMSPYIEGGGIMGYYQVQYKNLSAQTAAQGTEAKARDSLTETGYYGDAGLEIRFSEKFGVKAGYRYQMMSTRPFNTLGDNKIKYAARVLHFGVVTQF